METTWSVSLSLGKTYICNAVMDGTSEINMQHGIFLWMVFQFDLHCTLFLAQLLLIHEVPAIGSLLKEGKLFTSAYCFSNFCTLLGCYQLLHSVPFPNLPRFADYLLALKATQTNEPDTLPLPGQHTLPSLQYVLALNMRLLWKYLHTTVSHMYMLSCTCIMNSEIHQGILGTWTLSICSWLGTWGAEGSVGQDNVALVS